LAEIRPFQIRLCRSLLGLPAFGQAGTSDIAGSVRDETGAILPNVKLTLTRGDNGLARNLATGADGTFIAIAFPAGAYSIKAEPANFKTKIRKASSCRWAGRSAPTLSWGWETERS